MNTWNISGTITDSNLNALNGIPVVLSGGASGTTTTDATGHYSFNNLNAGATYTITPNEYNISFSPNYLTYADLSSDVTNGDFTGEVKNLDNVIVYPNPFKNEVGVNKITFYNLTSTAKLTIYSISGRLIFEADTESIEYQWDVNDTAGNKVSAGVYIYYITNENGNQKTGKIAIVK